MRNLEAKDRLLIVGDVHALPLVMDCPGGGPRPLGGDGHVKVQCDCGRWCWRPVNLSLDVRWSCTACALRHQPTSTDLDELVITPEGEAALDGDACPEDPDGVHFIGCGCEDADTDWNYGEEETDE